MEHDTLQFYFSGAEGIMSVRDTLTTGMIGKEIRFGFTKEWEGLTKTLLYAAGDIVRTVPYRDEGNVIPADVLTQAGERLNVGVLGESADGHVVIPTIMAAGPVIRQGADVLSAPADPDTISVHMRLLAQIGNLSELETADKTSLVAAVNEAARSGGSSGGMSQTLRTAIYHLLMDAAYLSGGHTSHMAALAELLSGEDTGGGSTGGNEGSGDGGDSGDGGETEVTLSRISAVYTGGDVAVGTAVTALTGIVVTAHYSDGSAVNVTGYTLSGTIGEGSNTVTVSYGGKTTTFTVTGVADSGGTGGEAPAYSIVEGYFIRNEGYFSANTGYNTAYFEVKTGETYTVTASNGKYAPQFALVASGYSGETSGTYTFLDCVNEHTDKIAVYTTTYTVPQDGCLLIPYGVASTFEIVQE